MPAPASHPLAGIEFRALIELSLNLKCLFRSQTWKIVTETFILLMLYVTHFMGNLCISFPKVCFLAIRLSEKSS